MRRKLRERRRSRLALSAGRKDITTCFRLAQPRRQPFLLMELRAALSRVRNCCLQAITCGLKSAPLHAIRTRQEVSRQPAIDPLAKKRFFASLSDAREAVRKTNPPSPQQDLCRYIGKRQHHRRGSENESTLSRNKSCAGVFAKPERQLQFLRQRLCGIPAIVTRWIAIAVSIKSMR